MRRNFYVSVRRDVPDGDVRLLAGPFPTHEMALSWIAPARAAADRLDAKAVWYGFGTTQTPSFTTHPGLLNAHLGLDTTPTAYAEDDLVRATVATERVPLRAKGRVLDTGTFAYHRVYWPAVRRVTYYLGTALRRFGRLGE